MTKKLFLLLLFMFISPSFLLGSTIDGEILSGPRTNVMTRQWNREDVNCGCCSLAIGYSSGLDYSTWTYPWSQTKVFCCKSFFCSLPTCCIGDPVIICHSLLYCCPKGNHVPVFPLASR